MSWKRMFSRSKAFEASERSITASIVGSAGCFQNESIKDPKFLIFIGVPQSSSIEFLAERG